MTHLKPFDPRQLQRELWRDRILRGLILLGVPLVGGGISFWADQVQEIFGLMMMMLVGAWLGLSLMNARAWGQIANLDQLMQQPIETIEEQLAWVLNRKLLTPQVRLMALHRLAIVRHEQQRYSEVIAICHSILTRRLRGATVVKQHLLLMLCESQLACKDVQGAFLTLTALSREPLGLVRMLQKLALQIRYHVMVGHYDHALTDIHRKIQLVELMPTLQCGIIHQMLATAAEETDKPKLAEWLTTRAQLLLSPEQLEDLQTSGNFATVTQQPS